MTRLSLGSGRRVVLVCLLAWLWAPLAAQTKPDAVLFPPNAKYVPGRVLVRFRPGRSEAARAKAHSKVGAHRLLKMQHVNSLELVELAAGTAVPDAIGRYRRNRDVLYAEPDYILHKEDKVPKDPLFDLLWGLHNTGQQNGTAGADIAAPQAWELTTGSANVVVADIDTGIDYQHPDLAPNLLPGMFFAGDELYDYVGHGTHTAGTIGAVGDNEVGVAGVNWHVSIVPCKFMTLAGGTTSAAIQCLDYVAGLKDQGLNIIATNNSWGSYASSQALYDAISAQMDRGILFIAAAGNDAVDNDVYPHYPSAYDLPNIVSVAATDRMDRLATFSNYGPRSVHLGAPGVGVVSTFPAASYESLDGTSMATPHVTGVSALLKAYLPGLDWRGIKNRMLAGADATSSLAGTATHSRLNAYGALTCTDRPLFARLAPRSDVIDTVAGAHVQFAALNVNCERAAGEVTITVLPSGESLILRDDGSGGDRAAGDGIYAADFIAPEDGDNRLVFPNGESVQVRALRAYKYQKTTAPYREISGTSLALDDETAKAIDLPFAIRFGGRTFTRVYVSSDGFISLDRAFALGSPYPLPWPTFGTVIAPWWDDFAPTFDSPRNVYWAVNGTAPNRELVIEWRDLAIYGYDPGAAGSGATFETVFFENSDDVLFNYKDVDVSAGPWWTTGGGGASVAIQVGPTAGTQYSYNAVFSPPPLPLTTGLTLRWTLADRDLGLSVATLKQTVFRGVGGGTFDATITSLYGLSAPVTVSCTAGAPQTCNGDTAIPSPYGTKVSVHADDATPGEYVFGIRAEATGLAITHEQQVTLDVVDFAIAAATPAELTVPNGGTATFDLQVSALGPFSYPVQLSCDGIAGASCAFAPATVSPLADAPANATVTVSLPPRMNAGIYSLRIQGVAQNVARQVTLPITVTPRPDFFLAPEVAVVGASAATSTVNVAVGDQDGYTGNVQLSCSVAPVGPGCTVTPLGVRVPGAAVLAINRNDVVAGSYQVTVTGNDGTHAKSATVTYRVPDYTLTGPTSIIGYAGSWPFTLTATGQRATRLDLKCSVPAGASCWVSPNVFWLPLPYAYTVYLYLGSDSTIASFPAVISIEEDGLVTAALTIDVSLKGFNLIAGPRREHTVAVGQISDPFDLTLVPYGGYDLPTTIQLWTCIICTPQTFTAVPQGQPVPLTFAANPPIDHPAGWAYGDVEFGANAEATLPGGGTVYQSLFGQPGFVVHVQDYWVNFKGAEGVSVVPGNSVTVEIGTGATNGFASAIELACPNDLGPGITCNLAKSTLNPGESTVMTLAAASDATPCIRGVPVAATAIVGGKEVTRTATINLFIGSFTFTVDTPTITVPNGGEAVFLVQGQAAAFGSFVFDYTADVACTSSDPGVTCETALHARIPGYLAAEVRTTAGVTPVGAHQVTLKVTAAGESYEIPLTVIMQGPDSLILTLPNGYDLWPSGTHDITWTYTGAPGATVRLELLKDNVFDRAIAENVPVGAEGKGSYAWAIPDSLPFSQWCKVRIVSETRPEIADTSDTRVWVGRGGEIITPAGGNTYYRGSYMAASIFYTWSGYGAFRWELYSKDRQFIARVADEDGSGYFSFYPDWRWAAPLALPYDLPDGDYLLKMIPKADETRATWNPGGTFKLLTTSMAMTSPTKGMNFKPGQQVQISWSFKNVPASDVAIRLSKGGYDDREIAQSVPLGSNGTGTYTWTIPSDLPPSLYYRISVQSYAINGPGAATDEFSIGTFHQLAVDINGPGYVRATDSSLNCAPICSALYAEGSTVTLVWQATNSTFIGWSGACSGTGDCTLTMDADKIVNATFVSTLHRLTVSVSGPGHVTGPYISCPFSCAATYDETQTPTVTLTASADTNAKFTGWTGACTGNGSCTMAMDSDRVVGAEFVSTLPDFTLAPTATSITAVSGGSATVAVALKSMNDFNGAVTLSCSSLPLYAACSFDQNTVVPDATGKMVNVTITTSSRASSNSLIPLLSLALPLLVVASLRLPRKLRAAIGLAIFAVLLSCGGGNGGGGPTDSRTPPGTYIVSINGTSGTVTHWAQVTLVIR